MTLSNGHNDELHSEPGREVARGFDESERIRQLLAENLRSLAKASSSEEVLELFLLHAARSLDAPSAALLRHISSTEHEFLVVAVHGSIMPRAEWPDEPMMQDSRADTRRDGHGVIARVVAGESVWIAVDDDLDQWAPSAGRFHRDAGHQIILLSPFYIGPDYAGYVGFAFRESKPRAQAQLSVIESLRAQASLALQLQRMTAKAESAAADRERHLAAEQRTADLERVNHALESRSRLLSVVAEVSTTLARADSFEAAVEQTLREVGTAASLSRLLVFEEVQQGTQRLHRVFAEWTANDVITHAQAGATVFDNAEAAQLVDVLHQGDSYWKQIGEIDPSLRPVFERLAVRATGAVPFFIDREYAGCIAFDDCCYGGGWKPDRIDALTAAANAVAGAFQSRRSAERLAQERERAAKERAEELAKVNEALRRGAEQISSEGSIEAIVQTFLLQAMTTLGAAAGAVFLAEPDRANVFRTVAAFTDTVLTRAQIDADPYLGKFRELTPRNSMSIFSALYGGQMVAVNVEETRDEFPEAFAYHSRLHHAFIWNVPLLLRGKVEGFMGFAFTVERHPTEFERETLSALAQQVVLALELTRLADEAKAAAVTRERELAAEERAAELARANWALQRSVSKLAEAADLRAALCEAVKTAAEFAEADFGALGLFVPEENGFRNLLLLVDGEVRLATEVQYQERLYSLEEPPVRAAWEAFRSANNLVWCDLEGPHLSEDSRAFLKRLGRSSYVLLGLKRGSDCIGYLGLASRRTERPERSSRELMLALTDQIALMLECSRLAKLSEEAAIAHERELAAEERAAELARANDVLRRVSTQLVAAGSYDALLPLVLAEAGKTTGAVCGTICHFEAQTNVLRLIYSLFEGQIGSCLPGHPYGDADHPIPVSELPSWAAMLASGQPEFLVVDPEPDQGLAQESISWHAAQRHSLVAICALVAGETPLGLFGLAFTDRQRLSGAELEMFNALAQQATLAMQMSRLAEEAGNAAVSREKELAAEQRAAELAKANDALRRSAEEMLSAASTSDILTGLLREAVHVSGASSGAVLRRVQGSEFSYVAILANGTLRLAEDILQSGTDAEMRSASRLDPTGHFGRLAHGEDLWRSVDDAELAGILRRSTAFHKESGNRLIFDVPYNIGKDVGGYLGLAFPSEQRPGQSVCETIKALANQVGLALEFRRISDENERSALQNQRNAFARDLHDTLAQGFTGILMQLGSLEQSTAVPAELSPYLGRIDELARTNLAEARRTVEELRFMEGARETFAQRLAALVQSLRCSFGVDVEVAFNGGETVLDSRVKHELLLIVREALTNSIKHSKATGIGVKGICQDAGIQLRVWDNGSGFSRSADGRFGHYGMLSMRERAEQIGASLTVITELGYGTEIVISWSRKGANR